MPLEYCDVLLGMSWFHRGKPMLDAYNRQIALTYVGRSVVLVGCSAHGRVCPVVSILAIFELMKYHISMYFILLERRESRYSRV